MTTGGFDPNVYRDPNVGGVPGYPGGYPGGYPAQPPAPWGGRPGGVGRRWFARFIDGVALIALSWILALFFDSGSRILLTGLFTGVLAFVYCIVMESIQGRTVGKMLLGLRVRGPGGTPKPTLKQSAIRNAWTLLPIVPFVGGFLGFVAIAVIGLTINSSPTKQGKHDELAGGTQVIKD